jgi:hypothetical protein
MGCQGKLEEFEKWYDERLHELHDAECAATLKGRRLT